MPLPQQSKVKVNFFILFSLYGSFPLPPASKLRASPVWPRLTIASHPAVPGIGLSVSLPPFTKQDSGQAWKGRQLTKAKPFSHADAAFMRQICCRITWFFWSCRFLVCESLKWMDLVTYSFTVVFEFHDVP